MLKRAGPGLVGVVLAIAIASCGDPGSAPAVIEPTSVVEPSASVSTSTSPLDSTPVWPPAGDLEGRVAIGSSNGAGLQVDFYLATDGSYRFDDGRGVAVYDFSTATAASLAFGQEPGDPGFGAVIAGHPLAGPETNHPFLDTYLKWDMRGFCLASLEGSISLATEQKETVFLGLPATEFTGPAGDFGDDDELGGPIDSFVYTCDDATGLPLAITETRADKSTVSFEVLRLAEGINPPPFQFDFPPESEVVKRDLGFRRVALGEIAGLVGYNPVVPQVVPVGFDLVEVAVAEVPEEGTTTGAARINPPSLGVVVLIYRHGLDELVVSTRLADPRAEIDDMWFDPYGGAYAFESLAPAKSAGGVDFQLAGGEGAPLHGWAVTDTLVVTVGGDISQDSLRQLIAGLTI